MQSHARVARVQHSVILPTTTTAYTQHQRIASRALDPPTQVLVTASRSTAIQLQRPPTLELSIEALRSEELQSSDSF